MDVQAYAVQVEVMSGMEHGGWTGRGRVTHVLACPPRRVPTGVALVAWALLVTVVLAGLGIVRDASAAEVGPSGPVAAPAAVDPFSRISSSLVSGVVQETTAMVMDPAGEFIYILGPGFTGVRLSKVRLSTATQVAFIELPSQPDSNPQRVIIDPAGTYAYVSERNTTLGPQLVKVRLSDMVEVARLTVGPTTTRIRSMTMVAGSKLYLGYSWSNVAVGVAVPAMLEVNTSGASLSAGRRMDLLPGDLGAESRIGGEVNAGLSPDGSLVYLTVSSYLTNLKFVRVRQSDHVRLAEKSYDPGELVTIDDPAVPYVGSAMVLDSLGVFGYVTIGVKEGGTPRVVKLRLSDLTGVGTIFGTEVEGAPYQVFSSPFTIDPSGTYGVVGVSSLSTQEQGTLRRVNLATFTTSAIETFTRSDGAPIAVVHHPTSGRAFVGTRFGGAGIPGNLVQMQVVAPPATVPGAPTAVSGVAGNGQVTVSWTAPTSDGGSPVTGYVVTGSPAGSCAAVAPCDVVCGVGSDQRCRAHVHGGGVERCWVPVRPVRQVGR